MKKALFVLFSLALTFGYGCGKNDKNQASEDTVTYFNQFLTASNGIPSGQTLKASNCVNLTTFQGNGGGSAYCPSSNELYLEMDSNGSYFIYNKPENVTNVYWNVDVNDLQYSGKEGIWKIEGDKLVLEGTAETANVNGIGVINNTLGNNQFLNQYSQYQYDDNCFTLEFQGSTELASNYAGNVGGNQNVSISNVAVTFCRQ